MSIEWFTLMDAAYRTSQKSHALADPLERADWKGLGWATALIAFSLCHDEVPEAPKKHRKRALQGAREDAGASVCV